MTTILWILVFYLGFVSFLSFVTAALFFYEIINSHSAAYFSEHLSSTPVRAMLRLWWSGILSQIITAIAFPFGYIRALWMPGRDQPDSENRPPVLLIHGLYHNPSGWFAYKRWLRAAGFQNIFAVGYGCFHTSFDSIASRLEQEVIGLSKRFQGRKVLIMGHSLGGMLTRHLVSSPATRGLVAGAVTLGAPHKGSKLAALGLGALCHDLLPNAGIAKNLKERDLPPEIPCLSLYSQVDDYVLPQDNLRLPASSRQGWEERPSSPVSHVSMLYHKKTALEAIEFLETLL